MTYISTDEFAESWGDLLSRKYTPKSLARTTGRGIETAKNWLSRRNCPTATALIDLARQDDDVWSWICEMAGRPQSERNLSDHQRAALAEVLRMMEGK